MARRRPLLLALLATAALACARPKPAPERQDPSARLPGQDAWEEAGRSLLAALLETLHTFETFAAYRISHAADPGQRTPSELDWDPPSRAAWATATERSHTMPGEALRLHQAVASSVGDPGLWRQRRALAQSVHGVLDAANAAAAYRDALDQLGPDGPATAVLGLLDRAWELWRAAALDWRLDSAEPVGTAAELP